MFGEDQIAVDLVQRELNGSTSSYLQARPGADVLCHDSVLGCHCAFLIKEPQRSFARFQIA
jgi:hypothetical protein